MGWPRFDLDSRAFLFGADATTIGIRSRKTRQSFERRKIAPTNSSTQSLPARHPAVFRSPDSRPCHELCARVRASKWRDLLCLRPSTLRFDCLVRERHNRAKRDSLLEEQPAGRPKACKGRPSVSGFANEIFPRKFL